MGWKRSHQICLGFIGLATTVATWYLILSSYIIVYSYINELSVQVHDQKNKSPSLSPKLPRIPSQGMSAISYYVGIWYLSLVTRIPFIWHMAHTHT